MKKAKKKAKPKKTVKKPRAAIAYECFIDEVPINLPTQQMQDRTNELMAQGYQLLFVGQYGGQQGTVRVWYQREL